MIYLSKVKGYEGLCFCVWRNTNEFDMRQINLITGFFRLIRNPFEEFHGAFFKNERTGRITILSTEGYE